MLAGLSQGVRARGERFNRDTTRRYENKLSEQKTLAALKGTILTSAERCEKILPSSMLYMENALAETRVKDLSARMDAMEADFNTKRKSRAERLNEALQKAVTEHDASLAEQKLQNEEECLSKKVPQGE
mmetsp:Transcript_20673/g.39284  ORF Transcript_20673/g.39284 Transcript_20673/m.39284 type:complete len:129 (+) Transcript_20673:192-578(+)